MHNGNGHLLYVSRTSESLWKTPPGFASDYFAALVFVCCFRYFCSCVLEGFLQGCKDHNSFANVIFLVITKFIAS